MIKYKLISTEDQHSFVHCGWHSLWSWEGSKTTDQGCALMPLNAPTLAAIPAPHGRPFFGATSPDVRPSTDRSVSASIWATTSPPLPNCCLYQDLAFNVYIFPDNTGPRGMWPCKISPSSTKTGIKMLNLNVTKHCRLIREASSLASPPTLIHYPFGNSISCFLLQAYWISKFFIGMWCFFLVLVCTKHYNTSHS